MAFILGSLIMAIDSQQSLEVAVVRPMSPKEALDA
jgi:hypothetical protein